MKRFKLIEERKPNRKVRRMNEYFESDYSDLISEWLRDLYEREIDEVRATIDNEEIWLKGSKDEEEIQMHQDNIDSQLEYLEVLQGLYDNPLNESYLEHKHRMAEESYRRNPRRRLKESQCSIDECQKWVDYDMKKYHRISDDTMQQIKDSGFSVVKDQYGDYEVIAYRKDESYMRRFRSI